MLMDITVREGANVRAGSVVARIDDRQVHMAKRVAELERKLKDSE